MLEGDPHTTVIKVFTHTLYHNKFGANPHCDLV